jgi:hypothetical protein
LRALGDLDPALGLVAGDEEVHPPGITSRQNVRSVVAVRLTAVLRTMANWAPG